MFGTAAAVLLPPALHRLAARHPGVRVASREVDVDQAYAEVLAGRVDLALGLDYPDAPLDRDGAVELVRLRSERFALAVPAGRAPRAADRRPVSLAAAHDWILPAAGSYYGRAIRNACRRAGCEPRVVHEVTDTATSLAMVGAGLGCAADRADAAVAVGGDRGGAAAGDRRAARRGRGRLGGPGPAVGGRADRGAAGGGGGEAGATAEGRPGIRGRAARRPGAVPDEGTSHAGVQTGGSAAGSSQA
ncbi:LysR substrate-binding domain-containing protein [Streptomyces albulus]|nr:LysR substrate-binding domain-containing protein [Streptomyces noursei]